MILRDRYLQKLINKRENGLVKVMSASPKKYVTISIAAPSSFCRRTLL